MFPTRNQHEARQLAALREYGVAAAKARGVRFGRPRAELPEGFEETIEAWRRGEFTAQEAARRPGISRGTFFNRVRELGGL